MRLYLLPYAGGSAQSYVELRKRFSSMFDVVALDVPERGRRYVDPPEPLSIPEMARRIAAHIGHETEVYSLFGHSMGALLAFETVRELISMRRCLPRILIVSGHRAPALKRTRPALHDLPDAEFDARLASFSSTPQEVLAHEEMMELLRPRLRRDFQACETYHYAAGPALPLPIACLGGDHDEGVCAEDLHAWSSHCSDFLGCHLFSGSHFYFLDHPADVVKEIERLICLVSITT